MFYSDREILNRTLKPSGLNKPFASLWPFALVNKYFIFMLIGYVNSRNYFFLNPVYKKNSTQSTWDLTIIIIK